MTEKKMAASPAKKITLAEKKANAKTRLMKLRKEDLRERICASKILTQTFDIKEKCADDSTEIDANMLARYKFVVETNLKLLAKCLPDLKAVEMTGSDGGELVINIVRFGDEI